MHYRYHLTVGFRAEFLVGFIEENDNNNHFADQAQPPDSGPPLIWLPARTTPDSHDRFLLDAVVKTISISREHAISEIIQETYRAFHAPLNKNTCLRRVLDKSQFWPTPKWFVSSPASSPGHFVVPLAPVVQPPPPRRRGSPQATPPQLTYSWRPVAVASPAFPCFVVFPNPYLPPRDDPEFPACEQGAEELTNAVVTATLKRLNSAFPIQISPSCTFVVHVGLGQPGAPEDDPERLLALKKLITMLWEVGEFRFAKLALSEAMAGLPSLTDSSCLRVRPIGFDSTLLNLLDDQYSSAVYEEWMAPVLGPSPNHAVVREQIRKRGLVDYVLRKEFSVGRENRERRSRPSMPNDVSSTASDLETSLYSSVSPSVSPFRLAEVRSQFRLNFDANVELVHELYLIWRAPDVDTVAKLMTPAFWQGTSAVPVQRCAYDFVNLRNDMREARPNSHHPTIAFRLFPATLDPHFGFLWPHLCAALVYKAANCDQSTFHTICDNLFRGSGDDDADTDYFGLNDEGGSSSNYGGNEYSGRDISNNASGSGSDSGSGSGSGSGGDKGKSVAGQDTRAAESLSAPAVPPVSVAPTDNGAPSSCTAGPSRPSGAPAASAPIQTPAAPATVQTAVPDLLPTPAGTANWVPPPGMAFPSLPPTAPVAVGVHEQREASSDSQSSE
ncbi:hypothetical protein SBRCBS47491_000083 [Sporothrix bragantina]|uniref:Uncharacterized protein n=1 Tax=Sporothrix bragantina TaxID=671064 RepID=A0ABP0AKU9_9PEZI